VEEDGGLAAWAERSVRRRLAALARGCLRFAFHGRVSTEDWQDLASSLARQRVPARARATRCHSPPERSAPPSRCRASGVSQPPGRDLILSRIPARRGGSNVVRIKQRRRRSAVVMQSPASTTSRGRHRGTGIGSTRRDCLDRMPGHRRTACPALRLCASRNQGWVTAADTVRDRCWQCRFIRPTEMGTREEKSRG
jgi:hypothetical protein